jgi:hypothetical protein
MSKSTTEPIADRIKIPNVSAAFAWRCNVCQASASLAEAMRRRDGCAWGWRRSQSMTKQIGERIKIRSVSDDSAWGVGPHANQKKLR